MVTDQAAVAPSPCRDPAGSSKPILVNRLPLGQVAGTLNASSDTSARSDWGEGSTKKDNQTDDQHESHIHDHAPCHVRITKLLLRERHYKYPIADIGIYDRCPSQLANRAAGSPDAAK